MTASDLSEVFDCQKTGLRRHSCGSAVTMFYEPGCTFIRCRQCGMTVFAVPDWNPGGLHAAWNASADPVSNPADTPLASDPPTSKQTPSNASNLQRA